MRWLGSDALVADLARLRVLPPAALTDAQWERIDALSSVLPHAAAELLAVFSERDSLDHPAVAAAARDALGDEEAPTELALALDYRIRHLLVDEYQDTSPSQARLLEMLVAGWQPGDGRSLFCVGDPMQSIYAFREADVTLFLQAQRQGIGGVALAVERLGRNFRSSAPIVEWVNATFAARLPATDDFERGAVRYSPAAAVREGEAGDGVRVHPLLDADERAMAGEVAAAVAEAATLSGMPSIAILVRGRPSLPPILAALRQAGIEYRGVELESLLDRPAMRDLVALLRALLHDGDRTAWLAVLRAPWCGMPLADLQGIAGGDGASTLRERLRAPAGLEPDVARRASRLGAALEAAIADRGSHSLGGWLKSAWLALAGPATVEDASDLANAELLFAALDQPRARGGLPAAGIGDRSGGGRHHGIARRERRGARSGDDDPSRQGPRVRRRDPAGLAAQPAATPTARCSTGRRLRPVRVSAASSSPVVPTPPKAKIVSMHSSAGCASCARRGRISSSGASPTWRPRGRAASCT